MKESFRFEFSLSELAFSVVYFAVTDPFILYDCLELGLELKAIKEDIVWSGFVEKHHVENLRHFSM